VFAGPGRGAIQEIFGDLRLETVRNGMTGDVGGGVASASSLLRPQTAEGLLYCVSPRQFFSPARVLTHH